MKCVIALAFLTLSIQSIALFSQDKKEDYKIKRENIFEFDKNPTIKKLENSIEINFSTKSLCDVTIAIEDSAGKIIRHLASGVLGDNAPEPFQKNSKSQKVSWDLKDDFERYIKNINGISVRVSLGLKPKLDRTLYWSPHKRVARDTPIMSASPEGMYIYDGGEGIDHVRLFGRKGQYLKTIYPFPADKVKDVKGLFWHKFIQDNKDYPIKPNFRQSSLLTSGTNCFQICYDEKAKVYKSTVPVPNAEHYGEFGEAAKAFAVIKGRIALAYWSLNRFSTDGSSKGMTLSGPKTSVEIIKKKKKKKIVTPTSPQSVALSPDGKFAYLTGFNWETWHHGGRPDWLHVVLKVEMDSDKKAVVFAGNMKVGKKGKGEKEFHVPTSVACDTKGRLYVSDYLNDRIQVFSSNGKFLKSIKSTKPAKVEIHQKTNEIYVFSWHISAKGHMVIRKVPAKLKIYKSFEEPKLLNNINLPIQQHTWVMSNLDKGMGTQFRVALDSWSEKPTIWIDQGKPIDYMVGPGVKKKISIMAIGPQIYELNGKKLVKKILFSELAKKSVTNLKIAHKNRQRIYTDHKSGKIYLGEGHPSFSSLLEINPTTGSIKKIELPFDCEDMSIDAKGFAYLRGRGSVVRYEVKSWKEIPWDYGKEDNDEGYVNGRGGKRSGKIISAVKVAGSPLHHYGGIGVGPSGNLVVTSHTYTGRFSSDTAEMTDKKNPMATDEGNVRGEVPEKQPVIYPGRALLAKGSVVHLIDKHGKLIKTDALQGIGTTHGVQVDLKNNLYIMSAASRVINGKPYYNDLTGTLIKVKPGKAKIFSKNEKGVPVVLKKEAYPKRPLDLNGSHGGRSWVQDAEWMFGGVGYSGKNAGVGCNCWNNRFALDYYARSFVPEVDRYSVVVLDTNGNVILRIGRYGNVDDGMPLQKNSTVKNPALRSIGGDEVSLMHAAYLGVLTDRSLIIADQGNARLLSVKLGYHHEVKIPLSKDQ
ncbi:MAG: hypothetical protein COA79_04485 [Planctomycetota bacterium]|nr:MAG: hypothetical protein COA79_04485 [Planctomycetota bacterium]